MRTVDVAHLSFKPPFVPGSHNHSTTPTFIERTPSLRQVMVSYHGPGEAVPADDGWGDYTVLAREEDLSRWQRGYLRAPGALRKRVLWRVHSRETQVYNWRVQEIVQELRPKVIVVYDQHWMGRLLREVIDWPCRLVFSQRGLSFRFGTARAHQVYSLDSFDVVWTLTHAAYRTDRDRMLHYEPAVRVIPNGVDTERLHPAGAERKKALRAQYDLPEHAPVVLLLSRRVPKKGAHLVVEAWPHIVEEHPDALLWIVGGGPASYETYLERMAQNLGVAGSVRLEGRVEGEQTHACFQAADVFAFPTLATEGMSLALLEGLASGLPCVAASHRAGREFFEDGEEVLFVDDPHLRNAFVEPLCRLLGDAALREALGQAGRAVVEETMSYEAVFPQMEAFLKRQMALAA